MALNSEERILEIMDEFFSRQSDELALGRGDDAAVLPGNRPVCVSSDLFIEDVHFRRGYFEPEDVGYKALAVNVSDIAAMGAKPALFTMDLMVPADVDEDYLTRMLKGMAALARQNDMVLAGGDLSRADKLGFSISVFGISGSNTFLTRGNAKPQDVLFVVGDPGLARVGLLALEELGPAARETYPAACLAHLRPKPKVLIGTLLNAAEVGGLMDISDGLAQDLPRYLAANTNQKIGANLTINPEKLHAEVRKYAEAKGLDPVELAMAGGEDYGLLGAADPAAFAEKVCSVPGVTEIGTVTAEPGITINGNTLELKGFDHFTA